MPIVAEKVDHFGELSEAVDLQEWKTLPDRIRWVCLISIQWRCIFKQAALEASPELPQHRIRREVVTNRTLGEELVRRQEDYARRFPMQESMAKHNQLYDTLPPKAVTKVPLAVDGSGGRGEKAEKWASVREWKGAQVERVEL